MIGNSSSSSTLKRGLLTDSVEDTVFQTEIEAPSIPASQLDTFLNNIYVHYKMRGLRNIILSKVLNAITVLAVMAIATTLICFIDYSYLLGTTQQLELSSPLNTQAEGSTAATISEHPVFVFDSARVPTSIRWTLALGLVLLGLQSFAALSEISTHKVIGKFYSQTLGITKDELETISWSEVLQKLCRIRLLTIRTEPLTPLEVMSRICRRENYLIALLDKGKLKLDPPIPLINPSPHMSQTLEWALKFSLFSVNFGPDGITNTEMDSTTWANKLRWRFYLVGGLMILFSPLVLLVLAGYIVFKYGEELRNRPGDVAGSRVWSPMAQWRFRYLNEADHFLVERLARASKPAGEYAEGFPPSSWIIICARSTSMILGAILAVLLGLSFISSRFVFSLWGLSSVLYITAISGAIAFLHSLIPKSSTFFDPRLLMEKISRHVPTIPSRWRAMAERPDVASELSEAYQLRILLWAKEFAGIFLTPLVCLFTLPGCAQDIADFFNEFTVETPGIGKQCSFAALLSTRHSNAKYGGAETAPRRNRLAEGRVEKSFLSFCMRYPWWDLPEEGKAFFRRLESFQADREATEKRAPTIKRVIGLGNPFGLFTGAGETADLPLGAASIYQMGGATEEADLEESGMGSMMTRSAAVRSAMNELRASCIQMDFYKAMKGRPAVGDAIAQALQSTPPPQQQQQRQAPKQGESSATFVPPTIVPQNVLTEVPSPSLTVSDLGFDSDDATTAATTILGDQTDLPFALPSEKKK